MYLFISNLYVVLRIDLSASHILGEHPTTRHSPSPMLLIFSFVLQPLKSADIILACGPCRTGWLTRLPEGLGSAPAVGGQLKQQLCLLPSRSHAAPSVSCCPSLSSLCSSAAVQQLEQPVVVGASVLYCPLSKGTTDFSPK